MSRKPAMKFVFFPVLTLLFCAAILFWQFNPVAQAFKQNSSYALDAPSISATNSDNFAVRDNAHGKGNLLSNKLDLNGEISKIARFDNKQATPNANEPGAAVTTNKADNAINPTKLILQRRLAKHSNKKKLRQTQISIRTKKVVAEIEIVETEDPHNWSNVSSFLRNTSAINLESAEAAFPSVLPNALRLRVTESQSNSAKTS